MEDCFLILEQNILHQFVFIARIWNHIRILIQRVKCLGLANFVSSFGAFHMNWEGCGGLSDCEELVGGKLANELPFLSVV